ncbi:MAG TPA: DUF5916 domain-containing protein [Pyrinomonadaceae bacterium]
MARQHSCVRTRHDQMLSPVWLLLLPLLFAALPAHAQQQQLAARSAEPGSSRNAKTGAAVEAPRPKRLAPVRASATTGGARITITADAALDDYAAYRAGERFFVLLPRASFATAQRELSAAPGLDDARVEQQGADVLISFRLAPGMTAHVKQNFNRLDVLINPPDPQQQSGGSATDKKDGDKKNDDQQTTPAPASSEPPTTDKPANAAAPNAATSTPAPVAAAKKDTVTKGRVVPPEKAQPIRVPRFETPPVIDGKLDDAIWQQGALFKDFYQIQPGDNIAPSRKTEMRMGYDAKTLYIAFRAYDEPDKVRATVPKRDQIFDDDYVGMFLDTFNDQRKAYALFWSPLGVQADGILTDGQNEDYSPDIVMESKGTLTSDGFTVEVAIPFKSLRYEAGKDKLWGAHFFRRIKRFNNELDSWMPFSRDVTGNLVQAGHLTGLEGISTERTLELIPSITVSETGKRVRAFPPQPSPPAPGTRAIVDTGRFVNQPLATDIGVTAKYSLTPTVTLDFAYNPDFAQVEADATVVTANQRFPIFFQEKRPFFLEGKEIFDTNNTVVHTRAIIDPDFAAKLTGKRGRNTFGLILASDAAPGNFSEDDRNEAFQDLIRQQLSGGPIHPSTRLRLFDKNAYIGVLRLKHDVGRESNVGLIATSYNFVDRHNNVLGFDGRFKTDPVTIVSFEVIGTSTRDCSGPSADLLSCFKNKGFAYSGAYDVTRRNTGWVFSVGGRTRDYRADVGFTQRVNTNSAFYAYRWNTEPKPKAKLIQFRIQNFTGVDYDWQGRSQDWFDGTNFNFQLQHQTFLQIGTNFGYDRLFAEEFSGRFAGLDQERQARHRTIFVYTETTLSKKYSGYFFLGTQRGQFDFDFGAGSRFPRVSPGAIAARDARAAGFCDDEDERKRPAVCFDPQDPGPGYTFDVQAGLTYQPTSALRTSLDYTKNRLTRFDTRLVAFDENIYVLRATYQFTRFTFARARLDYDTLGSRMRGQFLLGYTPNPGTAFYVGYNDDLNRNGFNPFNGNLEPGFRRNGRTFFIKASYLFRRSFE